MKLNFKNITKKESTQESAPVVKTGIKLKLTADKLYDLDEIITKKRRDNDESSILVKVDFSSDISKSVLYHIAKILLVDHGIEFNDENFKDQINLIPDFLKKYEESVSKYYPIYANNKYGLRDGRISLESITETISFAHTNYDEYLRSNGLIKEVDGYLNVTETRPHVNIIEGTQEESNNISVSSSQLDIRYTIKDTLIPNETYILTNYTGINGLRLNPGLYVNVPVNVYDIRSDECINEYSETMVFPNNLKNKASMLLVFDIYGTAEIINNLSNVIIDNNETLVISVECDDTTYVENVTFIDGILSTTKIIMPVEYKNRAIFDKIRINLLSNEGIKIPTAPFLKFDFYALQTNIDLEINSNDATEIVEFIKNNNYCFPYNIIYK